MKLKEKHFLSQLHFISINFLPVKTGKVWSIHLDLGQRKTWLLWFSLVLSILRLSVYKL